MAIAADVKSVEDIQKHLRRVLAITFSGNYTNGGDPLDLTKITNTKFLEAAMFHRNPSSYWLSNSVIAGWLIELVPGVSLSTWLIKVYEQNGSTGKLTELSNGAYDASLTAATNLQVFLQEKAS